MVITKRALVHVNICALVIPRRGETTHEGVDVNNIHLAMINPDYNMMSAISVPFNQNTACQKN